MRPSLVLCSVCLGDISPWVPYRKLQFSRLKRRLSSSPHSSLSSCSSLGKGFIYQTVAADSSALAPACSASLPCHGHVWSLAEEVEVRSAFLQLTSPSLWYLCLGSDAPLFSGQFQQLSDCLQPLPNSAGSPGLPPDLSSRTTGHCPTGECLR